MFCIVADVGTMGDLYVDIFASTVYGNFLLFIVFTVNCLIEDV